jgi:hypothetical protein
MRIVTEIFIARNRPAAIQRVTVRVDTPSVVAMSVVVFIFLGAYASARLVLELPRTGVQAVRQCIH